MITESDQIENILRNNDSDLVFLGRELLRNPYFPIISAENARVPIDYWPTQYERAK
jgi:NADPH2 dehydrogenase